MYKTLRFMLVSLLMMLCGTVFAQDETIDFSALGYQNAEEVTTVKGTDVTLTLDKGTNSNGPKYYTTGTALRLYGSNIMTVSSTKTIEKVVFTFSGTSYNLNEPTVSEGSYDSETSTWTGSTSEFTITRGGTSGHARIQKMEFYFASAGPTDKTVTFINDASWNAVYVWAWNDSENFTGGIWPGVEITPDNDGKYTWSTTGDPTKIIFNDNNGNQTADLEFEDGATYNSQGKVVPVQTFTATFSTNAEWNAVYAYAWSGQEPNVTKFLGDWPGTQLTKDDTSGKYSLSIEATEAPEKIIFNDGGNNQTEDLDFVNGKDYVYTVLPTYTSIAAMLADITSTKTNIKYQFENLLVTYVNGSNTFVSDGENGFLLYGSNLGLVVGCTYSGIATGQLYAYNGLPELSVYADNINATLQTEGTETTWKTITPADIQNNINVPVIIENAVYVSASGKNLTFKVGETDLAVYNNWSIDITALEADKAYTLKGIGCIFVKNETTTYQIYLDSFEEYVAPVIDTNYYILGDFWGWDNPQLMTQSAETANVYTLVADVTVEADTYEYKLRQGDNWDGYQLPAQGNQNFVFGTEEYPAGTYTLTFTANLEANTLELAVERDALEKAKAEFAKFIAEVEALYNQHKDDVPAESQAEVEQAIQDAKDALNSPNATVESLAQAQADLQAAMMKAQSDALGLNENVTDKFDIELNWISEMGAVTDYKNGNENLKEVWLDTTTDTGKVIHKTVEKLENGTYEVKLIGGTLFTGNGETAALQADEEGRVMIYANNVALSIPVKFAQEGNAEHYQLDNVVVSDGKMEIGMEKLAPGSNRHFIQIEKVKMRSNTRQVADEEGQNNHWKCIAQTILGYEAYNNVKGVERANLVAAETKAAVMEAIPPFYAAKASYDALVQAIADAQAANIDVTEAQAVLNAAETTAAIAAAKAEELKAQMPAEQNAEITTVALCGEFNNWTATEGTTMTKGDQENVWTTTLDLTDITGDQKFKLVVNDEWIGNGQITIDAPDGWVDSAYDQYNNLVLKNSTTGYKTYNVTATWTPNTSATEGWTLKFEGKDQREGTANAEISKVELRGDFNNWVQSEKDVPFILTKGETENVWTGTLDLTEMTYDPKFKLVVNENGWIGNQEMQIDAPDGWVDSAYDKDNNLKILHSITGYNTYTVTATWEPNANANSGWTLKFEGKDQKNPVVLNTYTASFTTNASWSEVYAYAWTTAGETTTEFLGAWPGTPLEKTGDVYTVTIQAEAAPAYIIFNNGGLGAQTANLEFEDGKAYEFTISDEWAAAIAAAAAEAEEDGVAVGKLIEAIAKAQGQTGTDEEKAALQAAVGQYKADNAPQETDLTSQFSALTNPSKWVNAIGAKTMAYAGWAAPKVHVNGAEVALVESYDEGQEFKLKTGDVMYQDITGLTPGTYGIELFGAACLTAGRAGMTTDFAEGDDNSKIGACLYAQSGEQNVKEYIPCLIESNMNNRGGEEAIPTAKLDGIVVGTDGTIRVGLAKELGLTNWHFVQLKGVTAQVLAKDLYAAHQTELQALVAEAQALAADENKTEGKDVFQEALTTAELAVNSQWYNNAEIEGIINNLKNAIANFKKANYFIDFAAGEYYVIDAESGKMMAAGHDYGTRGIVNETGLDLYLTPYTESRTVTIDSRVSNGENNHFLGQNMYMDSSEWGFALEYQGFAFYILEPNSEKYINIDENDNLVLSDTPREFIIVTKDGVMEQRMDELADATETNPVDATFLLQNPNFNRNDQRVSAWEFAPMGDAESNPSFWNNHNFNGGNEVNNCAESFHAAFTAKQTVSGAPAGIYKMTAQGFFRQDDSAEEDAPVFFANGVNKEVPAKTGDEGSMAAASESFTNGLYTIEPIEFEVTEEGDDAGKIYVGITTSAVHQWVIFDNFQLKYYGKKDITDGISTIETEALKGNVYNLQGQKVTKVQKGLYIVNGRKMIQK